MKKVILFCCAAWLLFACSSSHPSIQDTTASTYTPFTEQKILLSVVSLSDNPPMRYAWSSNQGTLEVGTDEQNFAYWTAPAASGTYQVVCTVTDERDNSESQIFTLEVKERELTPLHAGEIVRSLKKQDITIGGVWVSFDSGAIKYITSSSELDTAWSGAYDAMYISYDSYYMTHTLWAAPKPGNAIYAKATSGTTGFTMADSSASDVINDIFVSLADPDYLILVGADSGIHTYNSSTDAWSLYLAGKKTNALFHDDASYLVYAATTSGIYEISQATFIPADSPIFTGNTCAVTKDKNGNLWYIKDNHLYRNNDLITGPAGVQLPCSIDIDIQGRIWCGQYRYDPNATDPNDPAIAWWNPSPSTLSSEHNVKSVASTEGLIYLMTSSGTLFRY